MANLETYHWEQPELYEQADRLLRRAVEREQVVRIAEDCVEQVIVATWTDQRAEGLGRKRQPRPVFSELGQQRSRSTSATSSPAWTGCHKAASSRLPSVATRPVWPSGCGALSASGAVAGR